MTLIHVFKRLYPGSHRVTAPTWIIDLKKFAFKIPGQLHQVKHQHIYVLVSKILQDILKPEGYH